jgi:hypothetical protein
MGLRAVNADFNKLGTITKNDHKTPDRRGAAAELFGCGSGRKEIKTAVSREKRPFKKSVWVVV